MRLPPIFVLATCQAGGRSPEHASIPSLDGVRGIAVLMVLILHFAWTFPGDDPTVARTFVDQLAARLHALLWSGWVGVDLFFVLSGYLITRGLLAPSPSSLGMRMKSFWMRRVLRIFPLYYAVLTIGTSMAFATKAKWIPSPSYWLYMQNYTLVCDRNDLRWTAHFWSLAIEEQFYFVWPIVVLTGRRLVPIIVGLLVMTVALRVGLLFGASHVGLLEGLFPDREAVQRFVYRATFTRADGLLMGALVAVLQHQADHPLAKIWRRVRIPVVVASLLVLAGLYVVANGLNADDRRVVVIGYVTLSSLFASVVSLCADHALGTHATKLLTRTPLVACGKVSYGMYMLHWPVLVLAVPHLTRLQAGMSTSRQLVFCSGLILAGVLVTYGMARLSFRFLEAPFLRRKAHFYEVDAVRSIAR